MPVYFEGIDVLKLIDSLLEKLIEKKVLTKKEVKKIIEKSRKLRRWDNIKTLKLKKAGKFDYKEALLGIVRNAPARGFTVDEVRKSVKAIDVIEVAKSDANFEDDVWEHIKKLIGEAKFVVASRELLGFLDDVEKA